VSEADVARASVCFLICLASLLGTAQAKTCKQVTSCEEAVAIWCEGYRGADADHDGMPCENVCHSRNDVEEIQSRIGCRQS
jgi:hypothetical protein